MRKHRLYFPIALSLVLATLCFLGLYYFQTVVIHRAEESTFEVLSDYAQKHGEILRARIDGQQTALQGYAALLALWHKEEPSPDITPEELNAAITDGPFLHIGFATETGAAQLNDGTRTEIADRAYFQTAMSGSVALERVDIGRLIKQPVFIIAVPLGGTASPKGVLFGSFDNEKLSLLLPDMAYGDLGYTFVCDKNGHLILGSENPSLVLDNEFSQNILSRLQNATFLSGSDRARFLEDMRLRRSGIVSYRMDGQAYYAAYEPLSINDWMLFDVVGETVVMESISYTTDAASILLIVLLAASLLSISAVLLIDTRARHRLQRAESENRARLEADRERLRVSEQVYRIAAAQSNNHVLRYDIATRKGVLAPATAQLFGTPELVDNLWAYAKTIVAPECAEDLDAFFARINEGVLRTTCELRLTPAYSEPGWFRLDATLIRDAAGRPSQAVISLCDVTQARERAMAYEKWRQSVKAMPYDRMALFEYNITRDLCDHVEGGMVERYFGDQILPFDERTMVFAREHVHPLDQNAFCGLLTRNHLTRSFRAGESNVTLSFRYVGKGTPERWFRLDLQMVQYQGSEDIKAYLMFLDIDEETRAAAALKQRSESDPLTGLLNRMSLTEQVDALLAREPSSLHALVMIDLDGFKHLNDTFGHIAGDTLLINVAERMRHTLRENDLIGRIGGDEFVVCLQSLSSDTALLETVARMSAALRWTYGDDVQITASLGVARYPLDGQDFASLYARSDLAMYGAKKSGKASYVFYSDKTPG